MAKALRKPDSRKMCSGYSQKVFAELTDELGDYNLEWVASVSDTVPATLYNWLNGSTRSPRLITMIKVARAIGFDIQLVKTKAKVRKSYLRVVR